MWLLCQEDAVDATIAAVVAIMVVEEDVLTQAGTAAAVVDSAAALAAELGGQFGSYYYLDLVASVAALAVAASGRI